MNCALYEADMYAWRPGSSVSDFTELFEHLASCPECARRFARIRESDASLRQTFCSVPDAPTLEYRILSGLAHERRQKPAPYAFWKRAWLPVAAMLLLTLAFSATPFVRDALLGRQVSALLSHPPAAAFNSMDQGSIMQWTAAELQGFSGMPSTLKRLQFRSASTVEVQHRRAVLLNMKNEQRASLLIVNGVLTKRHVLRSFHDETGSHSRWSDGQRTYVLLFHGSEQDMQAYMQRMGIAA